MSLMTNSFFSYAQNKATGISNTFFSFNFGGGKADPQAPDTLQVPWREIQDDIGDNPLPLLEWQTRCSKFSGRDEEMRTLRSWAESKPKASVKFICGPGGVGKSRLAAEFADSLDTEGWNAGFMKLGLSVGYTAGKTGTLIVIDYPEERQDLLLGLLGSLANAGVKDRLRLLLLTRSSIEEWKGIITNAHARALVNWTPVQLEKLPISGDAAYDIFASAQEAASENKKTVPTAVAQAALQKWMAGKGKEKHSLPLFLVAAGVYHALHEDAEEVSYTAPNVMEALVEREQVRLSGMATGNGLPEDALALALTYATLCKSVPLEELESDEAEPFRKFLGLDDGKPWADLLVKSGHVQDGILRNLEPDIVGADFVHATLDRNKKLAGELVWRAAARDAVAAIGTFGRLIYDVQDTLGRKGPHLHDRLEKHLDQHPERCEALSDWASYPHPMTPMLKACCVRIGLHALGRDMPEEKRATLLNNLSIDQSALGQREAALAAIQEAVDLYRKLAQQNPAAFAPDLASSLNNLSNRLSALGQREAALAAIQEAVDLCRKLAQQNPAAFEPNLASSLNNLSVDLSDLGQREAALAAIQEAVDLYRKLAQQNPAAFAPDLAMSLNNLSNRLSDLGQREAALAAIQEAVDLYRKLAQQNPAAFEPDLAMSLGAMTQIRNATGMHAEALESIQQSNALFRKYAERHFLAFGLYVAMTYVDMAQTLVALGREEEAKEAEAQAEEAERRLAEARRAAPPALDHPRPLA